MFHFALTRALRCIALLVVLTGCSDNPAVTVSASYLEKKGEETVEVGSVGMMTSNRVGALVSVGGSSKGQISVRIAKIADNEVVLEVAHPEFESQQVKIRLGESSDVFFGDGSSGVRLRFTEAK
jgi:hypothetical protein